MQVVCQHGLTAYWRLLKIFLVLASLSREISGKHCLATPYLTAARPALQSGSSAESFSVPEGLGLAVIIIKQQDSLTIFTLRHKQYTWTQHIMFTSGRVLMCHQTIFDSTRQLCVVYMYVLDIDVNV